MELINSAAISLISMANSNSDTMNQFLFQKRNERILGEDPEKKSSYDELPYESRPFPQTHADRLATLGRLFGMSPARVTQCRVLELGCASGGNLIPMAYHLPGSEFVGVDLSGRQVAMGHEAIEDLGLKNIRIEHASIMDVDSSWGVFDYIICHGVYSWVPDEVQDRILTIASENLASQGIAYVSYNTYPGWHMREMIRHMMLYHANQFQETQERIDQARALVDFLAESVPAEDDPYGLLLQTELDNIRRSSDSYLFHDHMEVVNAPVYFYQFAERADRHGLQYLSEANFATVLTSGFPDEVAETLDRISDDLIRNEQYMDFVRNRMFRQTLLCRKGISLKRGLGGEDVSGLLVASAACPKEEPVDLSPGAKQSFEAPGGLPVQTEFPLTKAALTVLWEHWPRAIDLDTLFREASRRLCSNPDHRKAQIQKSRRVLADDLLHCYAANAVEFRTWQADFVIEVSEWPRVSGLASYMAGKEQFAVNQRHLGVHLDPVARELVSLLDGTRDRPALIKHLGDLVDKGTLVVNEGGESSANAQKTKADLSKAVEEGLAKLATNALLVG
jgi:methyltransferase-like protein/cyclopropane fatty-acyl-phospholipid synthase-like methyltransferase